MRAIVALLFLLAGGVAEAQRGEICRFPALDTENPFRRWLASQEVTCVPAGEAVAFPAGSWNVFARAEGAVSAAPLLIEGGGTPALLSPELVPGAVVAPLLPEQHGGVLYAPRRGSAVPVDSARVIVPADEPLWLFVLDKTTPVALIPIAPLAAGTEHTVDARNGGPAAIVGWLQVPEAERRALETATGLSTPVIRAGSRDADLLPRLTLLHGAFFRVREVSTPTAELRLEGRGWVPDRRVVKVQPGITVAAVPLLVRGAGTLVVHWNTDQDLAALDRSVGTCDPDEEPPQVVIALSKCPGPRPGQRFDAVECTPLREEKVRGFFGNLAFEDLVPGMYRAEMRYGKLPPSINAGSVGPLRIAELRIFATYFTAHGSVTRGGEPLGEEVRIELPGGVGYAPEETDEYRAVFRPPSLGPDAQIKVIACDGDPRAIVLTDEPMRLPSRFDIDIPANSLSIHVTDTFTRESLAGAKVKLEAMSIRGRVVFDTTATTDERGRVLLKSVPVRELRLTVTLAGYEKRLVEPFTMPESGRHEVDAQLIPLLGTHGRIVSERAFEGGAVVWFSPAGAETERADLAADGTFIYANRHTPEETMAVVSASHPLWVVRAPATNDRENLTIRFPDAPAVAFNVWLTASAPPTETRHIGVVIGGVRVPQPVLAQHQTLRGDPPLMRGNGPQEFRDVLATGPIDVLFGPTADEVVTRVRPMDLFALPQFAGVPRQRLEPGASDVVFTPSLLKSQ